MSKLALEWYTGCNGGPDMEARKNAILGSRHVLEVLLGILERKAAKNREMVTSDYDCVAWAYKQAHINGRIEESDQLCKLLRSALDHE